MGIKNFILPSKDLYHPLVVKAILNSTGLLPNQQVVSHTSCPVLVKPAGHSKGLSREPSATKTQLRTTARNKEFQDSSLTLSNSQEAFISANWKKIWFLFCFHLAKTFCWHQKLQKVSAKSISVLASFQLCAIQCIKLYATTRKQPISAWIPVLKTKIECIDFLTG